MREKLRGALGSLSLAHENYTPIKLFSHLSPGIRLERECAQYAIILIREEKMEIRAAGCCMRER